MSVKNLNKGYVERFPVHKIPKQKSKFQKNLNSNHFQQ